MKMDRMMLLQQFFGLGNGLTWEKIENNPEIKEHILPWINRIKLGQPSMLPRRVGQDLYWYAVADSKRQLRQLGSEMKSFVGFTKSDFRGRKIQLDPNDSVEAALIPLTGESTYKIRTSDHNKQSREVWKRLLILKDLWEAKPLFEDEQVRSVGRVLREFYMALQTGNRAGAEEALQLLEKCQLLESFNISFLYVQLLENFGAWEEIMNLPGWPELVKLQGRRPLLVTQALIKALYRCELATFEKSGNYSGVAAHFSDTIYPQYQELFRFMASMRDPDLLKCFMLVAVTGKPAQPELRDTILAMENHTETERDYLIGLASLMDADGISDISGRAAPAQPSPQAPSTIELANEAFHRGEYDRAVRYAKAASAVPIGVKILFEAAYEMQAIDIQQAALEKLVNLEPEERESFLASRRNRELFEQFTGLEIYQEEMPIDEMLPSDWSQWLSRLNQRGHWKEALRIAVNGSVEWDADAFLSQPGMAQRLDELLEHTRDDQAEKTLADALPHLLAFLQRDTTWPRRELRNVYQLLLDLLVMSSEGSDDELTLFNELASAILALGPNEKTYVELMAYARQLWRQYSAPGKLDWLLDFLDLLLFYPSSNVEERLNFLLEAAGSLNTFSRHIGNNQLVLLSIIFADLEQTILFEELAGNWNLEQSARTSPDENLLEDLTGKSVAVYTLSERVAKRVKELLERLVQDIRVTPNWERAGSEQLKQLARNADIFVMTWASAKHAATQFIKVNRPDNKPLLLARGKGSSSIISAINDYLVEEQS